LVSVGMAIILNFQQRFAFFKQIQHKLELEHVQKELLQLSQTDDLTKVYNRRFFMQEAERLFALADRQKADSAFILFDIDHFKRINDTYGHITGDKILIELMQRIQGVMRASDVLARFGGEEFMLLLPFTSLSSTLLVAEKIRQFVAETPFTIDGQTIPVTISLGVSVRRAGQEDFESVLPQADQALYEAKTSGRNRVCHFSDEPYAPKVVRPSILERV
jgi:diguanylate cyclase (GGDEF)-like protein